MAVCFVAFGSAANCVNAGADPVIDNARTVSWTSNNIDTLKRIFADTTAVNAFFLSLFPDLDPEPKVGEYALVELHRDGKIQLVITVAFSRNFYNHLYIVGKEGEELQAFEVYRGDATISNLNSSIVDLDGDGRKQFLLPRYLAPYAGAKPVPIMTDVYAWNGRQYEMANASYKNYYRDTVLPRLHAALGRAEQGEETKDPKAIKALKEKYLKEIEAVNAIVDR